MIEFFKYLDVSYKMNSKLYNKIAEEKIFSQYGVDFCLKNKITKIINNIKLIIYLIIYPFVPKYIIEYYKNKKDIYCFCLMSKILLNDMKSHVKIDVWNDNSVIVYWYLEILEKEL